MVKVMLVGLIGAMSASAAVTGSQVSGDPDVQGGVTPLEAKIAAKHKILVSDQWGGGHRMIFDFSGRKGWIVEPKQPRSDRPWVWTMQWMGAYLNRTGAPTLVETGYCHVHLEAFDMRCNEEGLKALAARLTCATATPTDIIRMALSTRTSLCSSSSLNKSRFSMR